MERGVSRMRREGGEDVGYGREKDEDGGAGRGERGGEEIVLCSILVRSDTPRVRLRG